MIAYGLIFQFDLIYSLIHDPLIQFSNSSEIVLQETTAVPGEKIVDIIDSKTNGKIIVFLSAKQFLNGGFIFSSSSQNNVLQLTVMNLQSMNIYSNKKLQLEQINSVSFNILLVSTSIIYVSDQLIYIQLSYGKII